MHHLDARTFLFRAVDVYISDWLRETKALPSTTLAARLHRVTEKAVGVVDVVDGETGEIVSFPGELLWLPLSQIVFMCVAGTLDEPDAGSADALYPEPEPAECESDADNEPLAEQWVAPPVGVPVEVQRYWQPEAPAVTREPERVSRVEIAGTHTVGSLMLTVHKAGVELRFPDADGFPRMVPLDDEETADLALAAFLALALIDTAEESPEMALTLAQIEKTLLAIKHFERAAEVAVARLEQELPRQGTDASRRKDRTLITGTWQTGALRRASLDLSRALVDLRRPQ